MRAVKVGRRPPEGEGLTARASSWSTLEVEARQGFLGAHRATGGSHASNQVTAVGSELENLPSEPPEWWIGAVAGFRDAAKLRGHTEGSGVCHPFAARGGMKLFGATVVGAIRRLGHRMGP